MIYVNYKNNYSINENRKIFIFFQLSIFEKIFVCCWILFSINCNISENDSLTREDYCLLVFD